LLLLFVEDNDEISVAIIKAVELWMTDKQSQVLSVHCYLLNIDEDKIVVNLGKDRVEVLS
jgi:hypothetical protein